ncbi:hypothetical protein GCM10023085_72750 [Actinomadura viridis]|uniref:Uncharacterized protein n=1 Tax=Actinomadura viridis TaxID=58110 RepID=A0A931DSD9_9ACTN|nr:hypothetical protein [Actinomadura viridis]MBG6092966.1 hypothetical protein [Actinomadura viridis]
MARFKHDAQLVAFPHGLFDEIIQALLDTVEDLPFTGDGRLRVGNGALGAVRLVEGGHLAAGSLYRIEVPRPRGEGVPEGAPAVVEVTGVSWDRTERVSCDVTVTVDEHRVTGHVEARMAKRGLQNVRITGDYQGPGPLRRLQRAKWDAEVRVADWWGRAPVARQAAPQLSARLRHPLADVTVRVTRGKAGRRRGRRKTTITVGARGRGPVRPVAAAGLLFGRHRIRRALTEALAKAEAAWNEAVPGVAERELGDRLVLRHQVKAEAVSRGWAGRYVAALHEAIGALRFEDGRLVVEGAEPSADVRLVEGEHAEPGARYSITSGEDGDIAVSVVSWDPDGWSRVAFGNGANEGWAELRSVRNPTLVRAAATGRTPGEWAGITRVEYEAGADLERWWEGGADAPFTASAVHGLGKVALTVGRVPAGKGRWTVNVALAVEGLSWGRRPVAIALLLGGGFLAKSFQESVEQAARDWNEAVSQDPDQAAALTVRALLERGAAED